MRKYILVLLSTTALAACAIGPDYTPPLANTPSDWHDVSAKTAAPAGHSNVTTKTNPDPKWWESFQDPELNSLVSRAASQNLTLRQTVLRIEEARANVVGAAAAGLPHLSADGSYTREQLGLKGLSQEMGGTNNFTGGEAGGGNILNQFYKPINLFQDSVDASWELDLFGRVRRQTEEAHATLESVVESHNDALVSAEAQVAQTYTQLRAAQAQNLIAEDDVKVERDIVALTKDRQQRGIVSDLDVDNAQTQLDITLSQMPAYQLQVDQAANNLAVLLGEPPGALDGELLAAKTVPLLPPDIPLGTPTTLAERRPDIREAAAKLHEATAAHGVAIAQTYPDITLTGQVGTRATEANYLTHWANLFYSFGPAISLPIFQGGQLTANIELTDAEEKEAALAYQQSVLNGLKEVENALASYRSDRASQMSLSDTVKSASDGLMLATDRYKHGLSSFIDVLTTESQLVTARQQYTQSAEAVTLDVVMLYRALGGGWEGVTPDKQQSPDMDDPLKHVLEQ